MQYPTTSQHVSKARIAEYSLWDGQVHVTVTQHTGARGFFSAAMLVEYTDKAMECYMYEGYKRELSALLENGVGMLTMLEWVSSKLNILATGTGSANGTYSDIVLCSNNGKKV